MTRKTTDTDDGRAEHELEQTPDRRSADGRLETGSRRGLTRGSRRAFLKAGAAAGALLLGGSSIAAGQAIVEETCESFGEIVVGDNDDFLLINNDWGATADDFEMCSWLADDGSYGYHWETRTEGGEPNYPQVLLGTKPWGSDSGAGSFPIRRGDVDELILDVDADVDVSGGAWNLAEEWWLMEQPPSQETGTHTHEIMLVLDWGGGHGHGGVREYDVWTDQFGNTIDYWARYGGGGGTDADFHIFRVSGGTTTGRVDLGEIIDFMSRRHGVRDDLWLSGIEVGNEYWEGAAGDVTFNNLDVTINGTTYTSGSGTGGGGDTGGGDDDGSDGSDGSDDGDGGQSDDLNAEMDPSTTSASVGERITFRVEDTTGNDTWIDSLEWDFGDGTTASGWWNAHSYDSPGTYTVALDATDNEGMTTTHEVEITVS